MKVYLNISYCHSLILVGLIGLKVKHSSFPIRLLFGLIEIVNTTAEGSRVRSKVFLGSIKLFVDEWAGLEPDILMVPIVGKVTMDQTQSSEPCP